MIESTPAKPSGSRLISRILPPAIRLWLHTQVAHIEDLVFRIEGRDREILSGHIPEVLLSAQKAVYQGIHLSQIAVKASGIRINLGQVIRRQPLRLLTPFPVNGDVRVTTADLNESLQSPLLGEGIYDFLRLIVKSQPEATHLEAIVNTLSDRTVLPHYHPTASIEPDNITLRLTPRDGQTVPPIAIATQLVIRDGHRLCLENPQWLPNSDTEIQTSMAALHGFEIDLGPEVTLTKCDIQTDQLSLAGTIRVLPEASAEEEKGEKG
ncbi:MAG: DUF2993 domain-containing protein [Leptolyngbya sp. SIO1E4]|nr:DUF2993 domain-containing protein [Leptolyngbya sp. SIO1E4]